MRPKWFIPDRMEKLAPGLRFIVRPASRDSRVRRVFG